MREVESDFDESEHPTMKITSINSKGQVNIEFSEGLNRHKNITMINSTSLEIQIIPSDLEL